MNEQDQKIEGLADRIAALAEPSGWDAFNEPLWLFLCHEGSEAGQNWFTEGEPTDEEKPQVIADLEAFLKKAEAGEVEEYQV